MSLKLEQLVRQDVLQLMNGLLDDLVSLADMAGVDEQHDIMMTIYTLRVQLQELQEEDSEEDTN